jgi:hypothetical protein
MRAKDGRRHIRVSSPPEHRRSILIAMAATPIPEGIPQRLAAIRAQMSLLADYL